MNQPLRHVLVLCTGNSARSILGEAILNKLGSGRFRAYSAGSKPKGKVHPCALHLLREKGYATDSLRSKSWDEFSGKDATEMDIVITVCGNAANETCPVWLGSPLTVHWGQEDPAAVSEKQQQAAFEQAYSILSQRMQALIDLPIESLPTAELKEKLQNIAEIGNE